MKDLIGVSQFNDIPGSLQNTAVGRLLAYHNLGHAFQHHDRPELLIIMCMDYRESLRIPENFAYVIRLAGARVRQRDFNVSYAIGVGGVSSIAVIGHTDCGMVSVDAKEEAFVRGLMERGGWESETARSHFASSAPVYEIGSETESTIMGAQRLRQIYKKIMAVPFVYRVDDKLLYLPVRWKE
ncbi:MAG TPA: carbonic anhydrase [Blastocatellia bacterium]|nr:carbonic anhydrase [Blastocatellia bacterium]